MENPSRPKKRKRRHQREGNDSEQPPNDDGETKTSSEPISAGTSSVSGQTNRYAGDGATMNQQASLSSSQWTSQQQYQNNQHLQEQQMSNTNNRALPSLDQRHSLIGATQPAGLGAPNLNPQTQPQGLVDDITHLGTVGHPQSYLAAAQPYIPGMLPMQENSQLSSSLLVGIQQLLQQLSSNLVQRGIDNAQLNVNMGHTGSQLIGIPWPQPDSSINNSSLEQTSLNPMHAVATSLGNVVPFASGAVNVATTIPSTTTHPPIHPGASMGDPQGRSQDYTTVPCRARGMPPDHNSQVRLLGREENGTWTQIDDARFVDCIRPLTHTLMLYPLSFFLLLTHTLMIDRFRRLRTL